MKYKIIADASCDLPKQVLENPDLIIVPIEVRFGDKIYPQGLDNDEFWKKVRSTGIIPKTSMPNQYLFEELMAPYVNKNDVHVIAITISSEMTATIHQVEGAVQSLKMQNITYRQSGVTTWAQGAIIMELLKFIQTDDNLEHVINKLDELINKVRLVAMISDLKFLRASGRLSATSQVVGNMLNIRPIVVIKDGKVVNEAKLLGEGKANMYMLQKIKDRDTNYPIYFGDSDCRETIENFIKKYSLQLDNPKDAIICDIGCVVGTHVGPNCYGMVWFEK